ncbi:ATP-dependent DNA helicase [Trichonephila clavipes]|nr:ATP-dependent DNA helicase [Trichonephila clavipes]
MSVIDTGGLPYEVTLVLNKSYIITNIDVSDGLANGAVVKSCHIDVSDDGTATRVYLKFPESPKTGRKWRRKVSAYTEQHNISRTAVRITRTSTVKMNNNNMIFARRSHLPLVCLCYHYSLISRWYFQRDCLWL